MFKDPYREKNDGSPGKAAVRAFSTSWTGSMWNIILFIMMALILLILTFELTSRGKNGAQWETTAKDALERLRNAEMDLEKFKLINFRLMQDIESTAPRNKKHMKELQSVQIKLKKLTLKNQQLLAENEAAVSKNKTIRKSIQGAERKSKKLTLQNSELRKKIETMTLQNQELRQKIKLMELIIKRLKKSKEKKGKRTGTNRSKS